MNYSTSINFLPQSYFITARSSNFKIKSARNWSRAIKNIYGRECFLSGQKESPTVQLETHHLFSAQKHPQWRYSLLNGVVLTKGLHMEFHRLYGHPSTPESFIFFIDLLDQQKSLRSGINKVILVNWVRFLHSELLSESVEAIGKGES
jgi:hypothetical protein